MIRNRNIAENAAISISKLWAWTLPSGIKISSANIDDKTIVTADVADLGITAAKLAADAVETAKIKNANVTLAKLAAGITSSHIIKFVKLGSEITTTTLTGLVVGDLVVRIIAGDGTVTAKLCATDDTLPDDPADADYIIVLRAAE